MNNFADIIAAISTPPGKGGVAIIRISGKGALALAEKVFKPKSGRSLSAHSKRTQVYGYILSKENKRIDDGLACYFSEGASFTGEETVEITSHGGVLISSVVLESVLASGARAAEPGEFTRRAFINGRLTLTDAEHIGTLLEAESREQLALSSGEARDALKTRFSEINDGLLSILSSIYARIDYPDEDLGDFSDGEIKKRLEASIMKIKTTLDTYKTGKAILEGVKTVICGKPNAGKSTLYNAILGEEAAIVTDIKGTTTDVLERSAVMGRVTLRLKDTAGIRSTADAGVIERIGIERTREALDSAELVIALFDLSSAFDGEDADVLSSIEPLPCPKIAILNKSDAACGLFDRKKIDGKFDTVLPLSAKSSEESRKILSELINKMFTDERIVAGESAIVSSARQNAALLSSYESLSSALAALDFGASADMVCSDIERALRSLGEADGREVSEAVTNDIFSKFCVGK